MRGVMLTAVLLFGCSAPVQVGKQEAPKTIEVVEEEPLPARVEVETLPASVVLRQVPGRLERPILSRSRAERWNIPNEETFNATVLALARICVSEGGWDNDRDCAAIYQVLRNTRSRNETLIGVMRKHSRYVTGVWEPRSTRHRWLVALNLRGEEPEGFPQGANWAHYEGRWEARVRYVRRLLNGRERLRPCPTPVIAWGGTMDDHIAIRRGLVRVDCGGTENRFWARPHRVDPRHLAEDTSNERLGGNSASVQTPEGLQRREAPRVSRRRPGSLVLDLRQLSSNGQRQAVGPAKD